VDLRRQGRPPPRLAQPDAAPLEAFSRGEADPAPPWPAELDDDDSINAWIHDQGAGRSPAQLVKDYEASHDRLVGIIEAMPDDKLTDPNAIPWVGAALVEVTFTGHLHDEHVPSVRAWLEVS
jgi:hypothetical protein